MGWVDYGDPVCDYICDCDSDEWIDSLENYPLDELKDLQRILTYVMNKTMHAKSRSTQGTLQPIKPIATGDWIILDDIEPKTKTGPNPNLSFSDNLTFYGNAWVMQGTHYTENHVLGNLPSPATGVQSDTDPMTAYQYSKEKAMQTQIDTERKYLKGRLGSIRDEKEGEAYSHFNVGYVPCPKTGKELKEWFATGRVVIDEDLKDDTKFEAWDSWNPLRHLTFIDPDKKVDRKAYEAETQVIATDFVKAKDVIEVLDTERGLDALRSFESKTYH